jgi:mono/diheme cytochrome c family protein
LRLGKYLFESRGCGECHAMDGRGKVLIDDPNGFHVRAPSIAPGPDSPVAAYAESDWVRAVRHGVDPKGRPLLIMPSEDYNRMNDGDFAALVGYTRSLPPAPGVPAVIRMPASLMAVYGVGGMHDAAGKIDHRLPPAAAVPVAASVEHGAYVANMCIGCHGPRLTGGKIPGAPPDWPPASNLTPGTGSAMPRYDTWEKLAAMMRTGKRPDGSAVSKAMPFASLANMNDTDVQALHAFMKTLPARKAGDR